MLPDVVGRCTCTDWLLLVSPFPCIPIVRLIFNVFSWLPFREANLLVIPLHQKTLALETKAIPPVCRRMDAFGTHTKKKTGMAKRDRWTSVKLCLFSGREWQANTEHRSKEKHNNDIMTLFRDIFCAWINIFFSRSRCRCVCCCRLWCLHYSSYSRLVRSALCPLGILICYFVVPCLADGKWWYPHMVCYTFLSSDG